MSNIYLANDLHHFECNTPALWYCNYFYFAFDIQQFLFPTLAKSFKLLLNLAQISSTTSFTHLSNHLFDHSWSMLRRSGLLPLEYRREILDLSFFFKCLKGYIDFNVLSHVNFKVLKYNIRNCEASLVKGLFKTNVLKYSFFKPYC